MSILNLVCSFIPHSHTIQFVVWLIAIVIFGGIGLILAIAFPVACCFFFGCRCKGQCGARGHYYRKKNERAKCAVVAALLSASTLVVMYEHACTLPVRTYMIELPL